VEWLKIGKVNINGGFVDTIRWGGEWYPNSAIFLLRP